MAFLSIDRVSKAYGKRVVIDNVSLDVEEGEFVSVVGVSASGKTTLLKMAAGLLEPDSGSVTLDGKPVRGFPERASMVFQNYSLLPWLSALENVRLAVEGQFSDWSATKQLEHARKYLQLVGLGAAVEKKPGQLSGGMRQRVAIARAFAVEPKILFLDEPFGALDALTRTTLQQELSRLVQSRESRATVLMITNSVDEARLLSDRVFTLRGASRDRRSQEAVKESDQAGHRCLPPSREAPEPSLRPGVPESVSSWRAMQPQHLNVDEDAYATAAS